MPDSEAKKAWMKKNKYMFSMGIMYRTEADIINQLDKQPQKAAYIKRLIRADIAAEKAAATAADAEHPED